MDDNDTKAERRDCVIRDPGDRNGGNCAVCGYSQEKGISEYVDERVRVPRGWGPKSSPNHQWLVDRLVRSFKDSSNKLANDPGEIVR